MNCSMIYLMVFAIVDDILIAGIDEDSRYHSVRLEQVLQRCRNTNLKPNKEKSLFR